MVYQDDKVEFIENKTFGEIAIGDSASLVRTLSNDDIALFALMPGDVNPAHLDQQYAEGSMFHRIIGHGMRGEALVSAILGTRPPGPGTIYLGQDLRFQKPVGLGDTVTANADAAGIALCAQIPIILTSRADNLRTRLASAVAVLLAHGRRPAPVAVAA